MSEHVAVLNWAYAPHPSAGATYDRTHSVNFGHGHSIRVSAAPAYHGEPKIPDPEQLLVGALASCHMLYFLAIAQGSGYRVEAYEDTAVGYTEEDEVGAIKVSRIELSPRVWIAGDKQPDEKTFERMQAGAHKRCFIANSLKSKVIIAARLM